MFKFKGQTKSFKKLHENKFDCDWYTFKDGQLVPDDLVPLVKAQGGELVEEVKEAPKVVKKVKKKKVKKSSKPKEAPKLEAEKVEA